MSEGQSVERHLRTIHERLAAVTGAEFFRALVQSLAEALQVPYAIVAECREVDGPAGTAGGIARVRAFWRRDGFGPTFDYRLAGTPCLRVVEGHACHYAAELTALFPADVPLTRWRAESYVGLPLYDSHGRVIGHIAVLDTAPLPDATLAETLLRLSAGRTGAELERLRAEEGQQQALAEVEALKNRLQQENVYLRHELISNVSHDLRSPLASLRGYLETLLLKEATLSADERHSYLAIALDQAERLQGLMAELFDLARLDVEGYRIEAEPVHLGELARDVVQRFQEAASAKGVTVELDVDDRVRLVQADIGLLERTLANLLDNALAHTPAGGRVWLGVQKLAHATRIEVGDTGAGIAPEELPRIFERFHRGDKARTADKAQALDRMRSGLGLAIVKRIVELHGCEIRVESAVGAGTRFWFELPEAR